MSYLARSLRSTRATTTLLQTRRNVQPATFHTTSITLAMSEADSPSSTTKDDESRSSKIETHKQDSVSRAKSGKGEWKPELATSSEQIAQHDKHDMSMEEMQKMGARKAEEGKRPSGSEGSGKA